MENNSQGNREGERYGPHAPGSMVIQANNRTIRP